jgi:uncharacterized protein (DUF169 family)
MNNSTTIQKILGLSKAPIAIGFLEAPPADLQPWQDGEVPAGCAFWKEAMNGKAFYTVPSDHYNCAIGSYTHSISLPENRAAELTDTLAFMEGNQYVAMSEVPGIPVLSKSPTAIAYAPLEQANFKANVVLLAVNPAQAMLLYEASVKSGAAQALTNALGRPACAVLPLTTLSGQTSISLGCKGNRTFTGLPDGEMYVAVPAAKLEGVIEKLRETDTANKGMAAYYEAKQERFNA